MVQQYSTFHTDKKQPDPEVIGPAVFGEAIVEPHHSVEITVGLYDNELPLPDVRVEVQSIDYDPITARLIKINDDAEYTLLCEFRNEGSGPCHVVVRNGEWLEALA